MLSNLTKPYEEKMSGTLRHLAKELASIRAGRANPAILDKLVVDYFGTPTPVQQVAAVAVSEARVLTITPWDAKLVKDIEKAIHTSDIGINPTNDGRMIRLVFPSPTEERRKQIAKDVLKLGEEAKIAARNIRRDALDGFKAMKKKSELTEDNMAQLEVDMQKITDKNTKEVDKMCEEKTREVMEL